MKFKLLRYIAVFTMQCDLVRWFASQTEMLSDDWLDPEFATAHTDEAGAS